MINELESWNFDQIKLSIEKLVSLKNLELSHVEIETYMKQDIDVLCLRLNTQVQGLGTKRITIHKKWPKTWWDAFKERWAPEWSKKRWPVQYETIDIDKKLYGAVCPHMPKSESWRHVSWVVNKGLGRMKQGLDEKIAEEADVFYDCFRPLYGRVPYEDLIIAFKSHLWDLAEFLEYGDPKKDCPPEEKIHEEVEYFCGYLMDTVGAVPKGFANTLRRRLMSLVYWKEPSSGSPAACGKDPSPADENP